MPAEVVDSIRIGPTTNDLEAFGNLPLHPIGLERCAVLTIAACFGLLCGNIMRDHHACADSNLCQTGLSSRSSAQNKALMLLPQLCRTHTASILRYGPRKFLALFYARTSYCSFDSKLLNRLAHSEVAKQNLRRLEADMQFFSSQVSLNPVQMR